MGYVQLQKKFTALDQVDEATTTSTPTLWASLLVSSAAIFLGAQFFSQLQRKKSQLFFFVCARERQRHSDERLDYVFTPSDVTPKRLYSQKNLLRKTTGVSNADIQNVHYNELKKNLTAAAQQNENVIFVSGHDHSLQYLVNDNIPQIISGSGSKIEPVKISDGGIYAHDTNGYSILEVFENGGTNVKFINARNDKV